MAGSNTGTIFQITTWGESHGKGVGVVVDGCPSGLPLSEEDIQIYLNRRKPGQSKYTTPRTEADRVEILSGVFEGHTTGTPISMIVRNENQHSKTTVILPAVTVRDMQITVLMPNTASGITAAVDVPPAVKRSVGSLPVPSPQRLLKELGISTLTAYTKSIGDRSPLIPAILMPRRSVQRMHGLLCRMRTLPQRGI